LERIGKAVEKELSRSGGGVGLALTEIVAVWPQAVGEAVSRQAWPLRVARDGTLHVATSSATWAFELDRLAPDIEARLGSLLGASAPAKLRFRVGPVPEPDAPQEGLGGTSPEPIPTSPETDSEAESAAAAIDDPELRKIVAKAARASLARARSGRQI
jgi:hypothetical protein